MPPAKVHDLWNGTRKEVLITTYGAMSREGLRRIVRSHTAP